MLRIKARPGSAERSRLVHQTRPDVDCDREGPAVGGPVSRPEYGKRLHPIMNEPGSQMEVLPMDCDRVVQYFLLYSFSRDLGDFDDNSACDINYV